MTKICPKKKDTAGSVRKIERMAIGIERVWKKGRLIGYIDHHPLLVSLFFFCLAETTAGFSVAHGWCPFCLEQFRVIRRLRRGVVTLQPVC